MVVYHAMIGRVNVVRVLWPSWPGNTLDCLWYILPVILKLTIGGSGQGLK